jgi:hypothetical protein
MSHHFQYCSQDSSESYSSYASTVSADENEDEESCRIDVAKRQKCNGNVTSSFVIIDNSQDVSHIMKKRKKLIGELHDKHDKMNLDAILHEAPRDVFRHHYHFQIGLNGLKPKYLSGLALFILDLVVLQLG